MSNELAIVADNPSLSMVVAVTRAASDPNVDAGKMERLWAIAKEAQADQARREYADAMKAVQAELPKIIKDRENSQTNSWYATLDSIIRQISPIYTRHGFSLSFDTEDSPVEKCIRIACSVMHSGGHEKVYRYDQPIDDVGIAGKTNKTQVHARGSAVTYGRRYLTLMVFNLNTGFDDDGNTAGTGEIQGSQSPQAIARRVKEHDEAFNRCQDSVEFIKDCIARDDLQGAATEWRSLSEADQRALWLAPSKGGCFTTSERATLHDKLPKAAA